MGRVNVCVLFLQRLRIAEEYGDQQAVRRAYSNLGNSYVFLGKYSKAIDLYK